MLATVREELREAVYYSANAALLFMAVATCVLLTAHLPVPVNAPLFITFAGVAGFVDMLLLAAVLHAVRLAWIGSLKAGRFAVVRALTTFVGR